MAVINSPYCHLGGRYISEMCFCPVIACDRSGSWTSSFHTLCSLGDFSLPSDTRHVDKNVPASEFVNKLVVSGSLGDPQKKQKFRLRVWLSFKSNLTSLQRTKSMDQSEIAQ